VSIPVTPSFEANADMATAGGKSYAG
jgi:hypothetical protein